MADEYIWFKNGKESKRTADEEGKLISLEKLPNGGERKFKYHLGKVQSVTTYKDGRLHSFDGKPASVKYFRDGLQYEFWYKEGELHREGDKPAYLAYDIENIGDEPFVYKRHWYRDDALHRDGDKPARINYWTDGVVSDEGWFKDGLMHRSDQKPANIHYDHMGVITNVSFWEGGDEGSGEDSDYIGKKI